ncbi:MAG: PilZ domain-containing protein [SAR324 cluster bacterium]|nr:PilZ domain-containing protein [SAR324 cluster bacterium]
MIEHCRSLIQTIIHHVRLLYERLMLLVFPLLMWFMLSGQFRKTYTPGEKPEALNSGDLSIFKIKQPNAMKTPSWFYWVVGGGIISAALILFLTIRYRKYQDAMQIKKVNDEKAHLRLDVVLSKLNVIPPERKLLEMLADGATHPDDILPLVESVEDFEEKVENFKKKEEKPDSKVLKSIYNLRHKLGFDVLNKRINFITTQMLTGGIKLECRIPHPNKNILFVSPILNVSESGILLKPPTIRKKPVKLKQYPYLICRIRREDEADYEFRLPILNQIFGKPNAVVLGHSNEIKKLFIREFDRVNVDIFTTFYVLTEEKLNELGAGISATKSDMSLSSVNGNIVDMSVGGIRATIENLPKKVGDDGNLQVIEPGDIFIFHLQGANLREDLKARILKINTSDKTHEVHLQFFRTRELERLKIKKFVYRMEKKAEGAAVKAPKAPAPPPNVNSLDDPKPKAAAKTTPQNQTSNSVSSNERNALLQ